MATKTYTVLSPLRHDGRDYAAGEAADLEPAAAQALIAAGAIAAPPKAPVVPIGEGKPGKGKAGA